jgi:nucleotide-binding universal stress UspA family protein
MLPKRIMSPIDFSEHSEQALQTAVELASALGSELCLVHVVPAIPKLPSASTLFSEREYEEELHQEAGKRLDELVKKVAQCGVTAKSVVGTANDVSMELLRIAEHNNVDFIIMATHGMTGWRKLPFGSVTDKVVRLADCPVLVLRAQQDRESAKAIKTSDSEPVSR